uniref:MAPK kinase substrate protein n=1 Tax=Opuntia streptacantha TaxID=393608 RepID=A0A7C9DS00_OPUST
MAGLQRSAISFRRQGSSGLVWDDKLLTASGELVNPNPGEKSDAISSTADQKVHHQKETDQLRRSKSEGGARRAYRSVKVQEAEDPPSPRVAGCGFCGAFRKQPAKTIEKKRKSGKRKP